MYLWEIIKWINDGGYIGGEWFRGNKGNVLYYDGKDLKGIEKSELNEVYTFEVDNE